MIGGITWKKENMASRNMSYFISRDEENYNLPTEDAQIMSRYSTSIAADGTDEAKIYKLTGGVEFIIRNGLSPKEDGGFYKDYFEASMLSMQGLRGGEAYKYQCPFMSMAFANYFKKIHISKAANLPNKIFGKMDVTSLVWCPAEAVSEALLKCRLIAAKKERGKKFPAPVSLESSMANLQNDTWQQFESKQGQISSGLLDECFSFKIQEELQNQVAANNQLKSFAQNKRSDVGTIVLLCGIWFKTTDDLNKHIESVHARFNLADFPQAHKVSPRPVNTSAPFPVNEALRDNFNRGVVKIRGANQCTLEEYAKGKNYEKPTRNDSTEQVLDKMKIVLTRVNNDFSIFDKNDQVMTDLYGDIVVLFENFFDEDTNWMRMFDQSAQAISENWNILGKNNTLRVSREDILMWVKSMWDKRTTRTYLRQHYLVHNANGATFSDDLSVQLNRAVRVVREIFGSAVEMRLPAKFGASDEYRTATVNISYFLIVQKLIECWPKSDNKLWDLVKRLKLDQILVPRGETDEAVVLSTLSEGIQKLREKLRSSPSATNRPSNVRVNVIQDEESLTEIKEEDLNDGYTPENFASYQESVYRNWSEEFPESATKPSEQEFQIIRRKNKIALERDAEKESCGRQRCQNRKVCFTRRKKQQDDNKTLYITQHCIRPRRNDKSDKKDTKVEGVKCVKTDNHVDVTLSNKVMRLYEGETDEYINLTPNEDYSGLRAATPEEIDDENVPTVPAKLCGVGLVGGSTNEVLLSLNPSPTISKWPAVCQITVATTEAEGTITDRMEQPRMKKTRRSKRNRDHHHRNSSPKPVKDIETVMNRFMESCENEAVGRRVDLNSSLNEEPELLEDEGFILNSEDEQELIRDKEIEANDDDETIRYIQEDEPDEPHNIAPNPVVVSNNVMIINMKNNEHSEQSRNEGEIRAKSVTLHDKTVRNKNRRLYHKDAKNEKCSRLNCKLPKKCFQLRRDKQQNHNLLYNSWNCLDIYEQNISLRLPHHEHLLSDQVVKLEEVDFKVFCEDSKKSRCSRPKCGDRATCFQKRSLNRFSSQQFYSNQPCYKGYKANKLPFCVTIDELPEVFEEIPPEDDNEDLDNEPPETLEELSTEANDEDLDNGLNYVHESVQTARRKQLDKPKSETERLEEIFDKKVMNGNETSKEIHKDTIRIEEDFKNRNENSTNLRSPNQTEHQEFGNIPTWANRFASYQESAYENWKKITNGNETSEDIQKNIIHTDEDVKNRNENSLNLQLPNQTKHQEFENILSWADEVDEETPLTQCSPWAAPVINLTLTSVKAPKKKKAPSTGRSDRGHLYYDRDTCSDQKRSNKNPVAARRSKEQQVNQVRAEQTMGQDQFIPRNNSSTMKKMKRKFQKNKLAARVRNQEEAGSFLRRTLSSSSDEGYSAKDQTDFLDHENGTLIQSAEDYCRIFGYVTNASRLEKRPFPGSIQDKTLLDLMTQLSAEEYQRDAVGKKCSRPGCKEVKKCFTARRSRSYTIQPDELYSLLECHQPIKKVKKGKIAEKDGKVNNAKLKMRNYASH